VLVEEKQQNKVLVTNHLKLAASTIAAVYKSAGPTSCSRRSKQGLKIKTFARASENAVQTQIWTALIVKPALLRI